MATKDKASTSIASQVVVRHHSSHEKSADQAEVLYAGLRVAYVSYGPGFPVSFLPASYLKKKLTVEELEEIVAIARSEVGKLADEQVASQDRIAKLLASDVQLPG